jgi:hypothetical protein
MTCSAMGYLIHSKENSRFVMVITPARENYHCPFLWQAHNGERHYAFYVVPTEVGLCP